MKKAAHGYVLVEVMVSGAVLLMALTGIVAALDQGAKHVNVGAHDAMAMQLAEQRLDQIRAQPLAGWLANRSTTATTDCSPPGLAGWSCTVTYGNLVTDAFGATAPAGIAPGQLIQATVSVSYCVDVPCAANTRTVTLQAVRWDDQ